MEKTIVELTPNVVAFIEATIELKMKENTIDQVDNSKSQYMSMSDILDELDVSAPMFYTRYREQLTPFGLYQRDGFKSKWRIKRSNFDLYQRFKSGLITRAEAIANVT